MSSSGGGNGGGVIKQTAAGGEEEKGGKREREMNRETKTGCFVERQERREERNTGGERT